MYLYVLYSEMQSIRYAILYYTILSASDLLIDMYSTLTHHGQLDHAFPSHKCIKTEIIILRICDTWREVIGGELNQNSLQNI